MTQGHIDLAEKLLLASMPSVNHDGLAENNALMDVLIDNCYELARRFIIKENE